MGQCFSQQGDQNIGLEGLSQKNNSQPRSFTSQNSAQSQKSTSKSKILFKFRSKQKSKKQSSTNNTQKEPNSFVYETTAEPTTHSLQQLDHKPSESSPSELFHNKLCRVCQVYEFIKTLGVGQYSIVYLVEQLATGQQYACKAMQLPSMNVNQGDVETGEHQKQDIFREVQILCSLNNDNIVKLIEYYEEDNFLYVLMEYLAGGQLSWAIQSLECYTESEARLCAKQILEGVEYLHSHGIAHRDLKLENVMLSQPNDIYSIKIVDFGFAKDNKESFKTIAGAPWYVAPEVLNEQPYDLKVDIWSFGCILYLLLTGIPPFDDDKDFVIYKKIMRADYNINGEVWQSISDEAKDLVKQILVVDPKQRISAKQALQHPWFSMPSEYLQQTNLQQTQINVKKNKFKWKRQVNVLRARLFLNQVNLMQGSPTKSEQELTKTQSIDSHKHPQNTDQVVDQRGKSNMQQGQQDDLQLNKEGAHSESNNVKPSMNNSRSVTFQDNIQQPKNQEQHHEAYSKLTTDESNYFDPSSQYGGQALQQNISSDEEELQADHNVDMFQQQQNGSNDNTKQNQGKVNQKLNGNILN